MDHDAQLNNSRLISAPSGSRWKATLALILTLAGASACDEGPQYAEPNLRDDISKGKVWTGRVDTDMLGLWHDHEAVASVVATTRPGEHVPTDEDAHVLSLRVYEKTCKVLGTNNKEKDTPPTQVEMFVVTDEKKHEQHELARGKDGFYTLNQEAPTGNARVRQILVEMVEPDYKGETFKATATVGIDLIGKATGFQARLRSRGMRDSLPQTATCEL